MAILKWAFISGGAGLLVYGVANGNGVPMFLGAIGILVGVYLIKDE